VAYLHKFPRIGAPTLDPGRPELLAAIERERAALESLKMSELLKKLRALGAAPRPTSTWCRTWMTDQPLELADAEEQGLDYTFGLALQEAKKKGVAWQRATEAALTAGLRRPHRDGVGDTAMVHYYGAPGYVSPGGGYHDPHGGGHTEPQVRSYYQRPCHVAVPEWEQDLVARVAAPTEAALPTVLSKKKESLLLDWYRAESEAKQAERAAKRVVGVGLGRIVALYYRPSTLYQVC